MRVTEENAQLYHTMEYYLKDLKRIKAVTNPSISQEIERVSSVLTKVAEEMTEKYVGKKGYYRSSILKETRLGVIEKFSHFCPNDYSFAFKYINHQGFDYVLLSEIDFQS